MKNRFLISIVMILTLGAGSAFSQEKTRVEDLAPKYQRWLIQVTHLILPQEKDVFMKLGSDRERDIFIESFWKQRDPTPGTPENEYRDEINTRFEYVQKEFRKGSPREGWMTDMGRIYMILGKPNSRESFTRPELYPCELWTYYGDVSKGMPTNFGLIFFRRSGGGEYKLYSPASDGPKALLLATSQVPDDPWQGFLKIRDAAFELASYTLSIVRDDSGLDYGPSLRSEIALANILESPRKAVNPSYATHFLNYKGLVSTEYLTNFIDSEAFAVVVPDPAQGIHVLHYAVIPKSVSVDFYEPGNQYFCNYTVDVSLRKGESIIYQNSKDLSYYFSPEEAPMVQANGICLQDSFPVIEGQYQLTVLLRNSVGKEFSLVEKNVSIESSPAPRISGIVVGYKLEPKGEGTLTAFQVRDRRIFTDPKSTFSTGDTIALLFAVENPPADAREKGSIRVSIRGLQSKTPAQKTLTLPFEAPPSQGISVFTASFPAADLVPDYYEMTLSLVDGETVLDEKTVNFVIATAPSLGRPIVIAKAIPRESAYRNYYVLAGQSETVGDSAGAERNFRQALALVPDDTEGLAYFSGFLLRAKQFDKALATIEKVKDDPSLQFDYWIIKGKALKELGRCEEAIACLLEGNKIYDSDIRLLNALGYCYAKTGQTERALEVLNASLRVNPEQDEAKKLLEEIRK